MGIVLTKQQYYQAIPTYNPQTWGEKQRTHRTKQSLPPGPQKPTKQPDDRMQLNKNLTTAFYFIHDGRLENGHKLCQMLDNIEMLTKDRWEE